MRLRVAFVPLLLLGMSAAEESAPIPLSGGGHVPICRGNADDAPGCITAPHTTYAPDPKYPKKARKAHDRGVVLLDLVVGTDGLPRDVKVDRGLTPELEQAAIDTVKQWKFAPATKDGRPVAVLIKVEVNFRLY
jgi:periplasmic protein TonB